MDDGLTGEKYLLFPTENFTLVNLGLNSHKDQSGLVKKHCLFFFFFLRNVGTLTTFGCHFNTNMQTACSKACLE